jgi:DNA-binding HxlR family transcriptional regulator
MVKRVSLEHAPCPAARALDVIGDWWSLLIIRDALEGVRRFSAFQSSLGIAKGMLATRLRDLVERGILETAPASDGSAYFEYVLTERGQGLHLVVAALRQWGEAELYRPDEQHSDLVDARDGRAVKHLALYAADGRSLAWDETRVRRVGENP